MDYQLVASWQPGRWRVEVNGRLAGYVRRIGPGAWQPLHRSSLRPITERACRTRREAAERVAAAYAPQRRRAV